MKKDPRRILSSLDDVREGMSRHHIVGFRGKARGRGRLSGKYGNRKGNQAYRRNKTVGDSQASAVLFCTAWSKAG